MKNLLLVLVTTWLTIGSIEAAEMTNVYLIGKWNVVGVKVPGSSEFQPPLQPGKWEFTTEGKLLETLGNNGATIPWNYSLSGTSISTRFGSLAFQWTISEHGDNEMIILHHLGTFKVVRE